MDIRKLTGDELELQYDVWSQGFEHGSRDMSEWKESETLYAGRQAVYGIFDDAGLQAAFYVVDMRLHFGPDLVLPMSAVNGVACLPASRGKGYASAGVRYVLEQTRQAGQRVSVLEAFNWDFYRNLGYEWVGLNRRYTVPTRILKISAETEHVRAATRADHNAITGLYTRFAGRYRGMLKRTEEEWKEILGDTAKQHTYTYIYERAGQIEGYLIHREIKRDETRLREFVCLTARAQSGLLGLLRRYDMQVDKFVWNAPNDDTLYSQLCHWDMEAKVRPSLMARIVDVPGALQAWKPLQAVECSFALNVEDTHAPWNAGTWRVTARDGQTTVTPASDAPDVSLDIQALTQLYFGTPALPELCRADRVTVHNAQAAEQLQRLLDGPPMWINDGF